MLGEISPRISPLARDPLLERASSQRLGEASSRAGVLSSPSQLCLLLVTRASATAEANLVLALGDEVPLLQALEAEWKFLFILKPSIYYCEGLLAPSDMLLRFYNFLHCYAHDAGPRVAHTCASRR